MRRRQGIVPVILLCGTLTTIAALGMAWEPRYYDTSSFNEGTYMLHSCHPKNPCYDHNPRVFGSNVVDNTGWRADAYSSEGIRIGDPSRDPQVVLFGDSHGCMWSGAIRETIEELRFTGSFFCIDGCSPFMKIPLQEEVPSWGMTSEETMRFNQAKLECLERWKPKLVIISMRWSNASEASDLLDFIALQGSHVLLIEDPPRLTHGDINVTQWLASQGILPTAGEHTHMPCRILDKHEGSRLVIRELATSYDNVQLLPTFDLYVSGDKAIVLSGKNALYLDDDHLLLFGARKIIPRLREKIAEILGNR